jgi:hypothetical protein
LGGVHGYNSASLIAGGKRVDSDLFYRMDAWVICLILLALMSAALEIGFRVGRRVRSAASDQDRSVATTTIAAVLGLLALLLGFSFSMAMTRYDSRYGLVVKEANSIGTTFLRAKMLPEPQRTQVARLLRDYVRLRVSLVRSDSSPEEIERAFRASQRLHDRLWTHAVEAVRADPRPVPTGLFVQTLNEMIDDQTRRVAAMRNRVPSGIYSVLLAVAVGALGLTGYGCGLAGRRNLPATTTAAVLITLVVFVITDLDRPRSGWVRVSQQSIIDLGRSIDRDPMFAARGR